MIALRNLAQLVLAYGASDPRSRRVLCPQQRAVDIVEIELNDTGWVLNELSDTVAVDVAETGAHRGRRQAHRVQPAHISPQLRFFSGSVEPAHQLNDGEFRSGIGCDVTPDCHDFRAAKCS